MAMFYSKKGWALLELSILRNAKEQVNTIIKEVNLSNFTRSQVSNRYN